MLCQYEQLLAMIFSKYVIFLIFTVVLLSFSGSTWFTDSGDAHLPHLPNMPQLFPSDGKVVEILDGSMERFRDKLVLNGVSAVLFYAPWCGQSLYAAHEFNTAAKMLHTEVVFIAINCWVGTCLQEQNIHVFPKLVAIHTQFNGVEYKGSFKAAKMVEFLQAIIRPFMYIGTVSELNLAKKSNQELVISYFKQPWRFNKNFTVFFSLALHYRIKDSKPKFAVVTTTKVSLKVGVNGVSGLAYHRLNHDILNYPSSSYFTVEDITSWIDANRYELVVQLAPSSDRKEHFVHHLSKGPALLLFLPMKLHMCRVTQNILETYIYAASQYYKCPDNGTSKGVNAIPTAEGKEEGNSSEVLEQMNVNGIASQLTLLYSINQQRDVLISQNGLVLNNSICKTLLVPKQLNTGSRPNTCDLCFSCQLLKCHLNMGHPLVTFLNSYKMMPLLSLKNCCSSLRPTGYFSLVLTSICCTWRSEESDQRYSSDKEFQDINKQLLKQRESNLADLFGFSSYMSYTASALQKSLNTRKGRELTTKKVIPDLSQTSKRVTNFTGAGCYSNRSVRFFIVDSTEYWRVAENLGVRRSYDQDGRTALVIADLKNDAHFVLDEDVRISNSSIMDFVMAYMNGNLTRRLISGGGSFPECAPLRSGKACVKEVVTSNFRDIVLDDTKDVLLLYYAPWCAYCQSLEPILLTVVKFFQDCNDVIIARINADENDLPGEFYVSQYPSFILFPAQRKTFSVRLPDAMERTASSIIHFVLEHGMNSNKVLNDINYSDAENLEMSPLTQNSFISSKEGQQGN